MSDTQNNRLQDLFLKAIELPLAEREDFLRRECRDDGALLEQVRKLVAADALVKDSTAAPMSRSLAEGLKTWDAVPGEDSRVGPYQLREELGRGGMGRVFRAERVDGSVNQEVAIKFVRWELVDEKMVRRFQLERQLMAALQHPYIARLIDAGELDDDSPYYVMEYIHGIPITEYCRRQALTVRQRVELMRKVCAAVADAHRQLVVHRDLKPGNVLVTIDGTPKLLDFGIAKPLRPMPGHEETQTQERFFSPGYAAPEQFTGEPVGVSVDVYALGVMLYELLSGAKPFKLDGMSPSQVERLICDIPPEAPSGVLEQAGSLQVRAQLRGDLDGIILRCLRKLPSERYASVEQLDNDLENYLKGLPVSARGGERWYRVRKFVARNTLAVAASTALTMSVLVGLAGFAWEARQARQRADDLQTVVSFQSQMFRQIDPNVTGRRLITDLQQRHHDALVSFGLAEAERDRQEKAFVSALERVNVTDTAKSLLDESLLGPATKAVDRQFDRQPDVRAALLQELADSYYGLSLHERGLQLHQASLDLYRTLHGEMDPRTLTAMVRTSQSLEALDRIDEAEATVRRAIAGRDQLFGPRDHGTLMAREQLGDVLNRAGRTAEAERELVAVVDVMRREFGTADRGTLSAMNDLASAYREEGRLAEAEGLFKETVEARRASLGDDDIDTVVAINNLGTVYYSEGRFREAEKTFSAVLEWRRRVLGNLHEHTINSMSTVGATRLALEDFDGAVAIFREAYDCRARVFGEKHLDTLVQLNNLAFALKGQGRLADAEMMYRRLLEAARSRPGDPPKQMAAWVGNSGKVLQAEGKLDQSEPLLVEAVALRKRFVGEHHRNTLLAIAALASLRVDQHRYQEAVELIGPIDEEIRKAFPSNEDLDFAKYLRTSALSQAGIGHFARAVDLLREEAARLSKGFGEESPQVAAVLRDLAQVTGGWEHADPGQGHAAEASSLQARADALLARKPGK